MNKAAPAVTLNIFHARKYTPADEKPVAVITRPNRRMCVNVAKAHYSGDDYTWVWPQLHKIAVAPTSHATK